MAAVRCDDEMTWYLEMQDSEIQRASGRYSLNGLVVLVDKGNVHLLGKHVRPSTNSACVMNMVHALMEIILSSFMCCACIEMECSCTLLKADCAMSSSCHVRMWCCMHLADYMWSCSLVVMCVCCISRDSGDMDIMM